MATIREKAKGVVIKSFSPNYLHTYRIGFNNGDETELDARDVDDLAKLWKSLCPEFGCEPSDVDYIERVS